MFLTVALYPVLPNFTLIVHKYITLCVPQGDIRLGHIHDCMYTLRQNSLVHILVTAGGFILRSTFKYSVKPS